MKAFVVDRIAYVLESASLVFAKRAVALSRDRRGDGINWLDLAHDAENRRVMEQVIGAVIVAVAAVEGMINEMLAGDDAYVRWGELWRSGATRGLNALEKCQLALKEAGLPELPEDRGSVQDMKALISLRNALVHSEPKARPHGSDFLPRERNKLEKKLAGKFAPSIMVPEDAPFIWQRCLGPGCAKWSAETESAFVNDFFKELGIPITREIVWDRPV